MTSLVDYGNLTEVTYPLFVYGTLREGGALARHYFPNDLPRVPAEIDGTLFEVDYALPRFPAVDIYGPGTVRGEIVEVAPDLFWEIAHMELSVGYHAMSVEARTPDGPYRVVVFHRPHNDEPAIADGDWLNHRQGATRC